MYIDKADSAVHQSVAVEEEDKLVSRKDGHRRQCLQQSQYVVPVAKIAARQFANDVGMTENGVVVKQGLQLLVSGS